MVITETLLKVRQFPDSHGSCFNHFMSAQGFKSTILNYFPSLKWLFVFVDWEDIWELKVRKTEILEYKPENNERWGIIYISLFCSRYFCKVSWNYAMNECIIHFIKYLSTYVKSKNITFCFCEQCLLYLSNFAGDHPRVQPAVSATREKEKLSKLKIFSSCIYNKYALKLNICQKFAERRIFDMIKNKHGMNLSFHQPN